MTDNRSPLVKAWSIVTGRAHDALDKQLNTTAGCRQAIREAKQQLGELRSGLAEANATLTGYDRRLSEINAERETTESNMALLARNDKIEEAKKLSAELDELDKAEAQIKALRVSMVARRDQIVQVVENLETELDKAEDQLQELVVAEMAAANAEAATEAIERAGAVSGRVGSMDTSGAREQILHRTAVADARLQQAIADQGGSDASPERVAADLRRDAAFEGRMRSLGLNADGTPLDEEADVS